MSAEGDKKIRYGVTALVLASIACESAVTLITPTVLPDSNNPDPSETIPSSEVNESFTGNFEWSVDQDIMDAIAEGTGLPSSEISGFTVSINRDVLGLTPHKVEFGTSQGPDLIDGQPVVRDYVFPDGDPSRPDPLYREAFDKDGNSWIREYRYDSQSNKHTVLEYPAGGNDLLANGQGFDMLYYPTDDVKAQLLLSTDPSAESKPILVNVEPKSQNSVVTTAPTPFSIQPVSYVYPEPATPTTMPPSPTPPPTPELPTATPEPAYFSNPNKAITLAETKGQYAEWVKDTCKENITMDPANIQFVVNNLPSVNMNDLGSNIKTNSYETGYKQARNIQLCDNNIRPINPREFGLEGKEDISIVPYIYMDSAGNQVVFQFAIGKHGIEMMKQNGFFSDKNGPRLQPADKLPTLFADIFISGESGGPEDASAIVKGNTFYESQGVTKKDVFDLLTRIAATGVFSPEDQQLIESTVFLPSLGIGPSANQ